jgi:hypothetical protein
VNLPYKYSVDDAVLHVFATATKRQRQELLRIFDFLAREPFTEAENAQRDHVGRQCQVKRFGCWTVIYWAEHKQVLIGEFLVREEVKEEAVGQTDG